MELAALIIINIIWLVDIYSAFTDGDSNLLSSGALLVLLTWPVSMAWGIVNLCITLVLIILLIALD